MTDGINEGGVNEVLTSDIVRYGVEVLQKAIVSLWIDSPSKERLEEFPGVSREKGRRPAEPDDADGPGVPPLHRAGPLGRLGAVHDGGRQLELAGAVDRRHARGLSDSRPRRDLSGARRTGAARRFSIRVVRTLLPGSPPRAARDELARWAVEHGLTVRDHVVTEEAVASPAEGRAWETFETVLRLDPVEQAPVGIYVLNGAFTSSSVLRARGIRAFGFSPFNVNFHDASKIHNLNERISVPHYLRRGRADPAVRLRVRARAVTRAFAAATLARKKGPMATVDFYYYRIG